MAMIREKLGVVGAGVMGYALIRGLLRGEVIAPENLWAGAKTESTCRKIREQLNIAASPQYQSFLPDTKFVLLCVKPSGVKKVLTALRENGLPEDALVISIVAGTSIQMMETALGSKNPVIRAMTNTPCIVGQGMTAICAGTHATEAHMETAFQIFQSVGECVELEESHFDAVTGLSGSGPAYLYLIMEALADGGVRVGLPREVALQIVSQTVQGAAAMVRETGRHPAALRDDVTTPAGCTIGALLVMEDGKIRSVLARAVEEATKIAGKLGQKP